MKNKKVIRLTESRFNKIVEESTNQVLQEFFGPGMVNNMLGNPAGKLGKIAGSVMKQHPLFQFFSNFFGSDNSGESAKVQNYMQQAIKALDALQKSGILQADPRAAQSVNTCIQSLQNFGKQIQQFNQQQNQQDQQQGQQQSQGSQQQSQGGQQQGQPQQQNQGSNFDVDAEARKTIRGDYGNGQERKNRLGSNYRQVQDRVNQMMRKK